MEILAFPFPYIPYIYIDKRAKIFRLDAPGALSALFRPLVFFRAGFKIYDF
jgi:hypothetical protein